MLQTSSRRRYPLVYPKCPALAFSGSEDDSQFSRRLSSVLLQRSVPVIRWSEFYYKYYMYFSSLTGTKLALIGDTGRDRRVVAVLFVKANLRVLYISSIYLLVYLHTYFAVVGSGQAVPK